MSAVPETPAPRGRWLVWAGALVVLAAGAYFAWQWLVKPTPPDMTAVLAANTRGVGLMDQYKYPEAVKAFEEVVKLAPDWVPGKINLGIALMNAGQEQKQDDPEKSRKHPNLKRATDLFREVLKQEPKNPHAHYCLGIILQYQETGEALAHFEAVTRIDPKDATAWFKLALLQEDQDRRFEYCSKALELDPYLTGALNDLQLQLRRRGEDKKADEFLDRFKALTNTKIWFSRVDIKYNDMGRYAQVIGGPEIARAPRVGPVPPFRLHDKLQVKLAPGARWATAADLDELRREVRARFGATLVVFDYDRDGKPDLLLLGAVVEKGQVRDLLLRNEGGGSFTDVTHEAGLGGARASLGCAVADFDNNGTPDLLITGAGRIWLFRNRGKSGKEAARFEDVSSEAGLDKLNSVCLGATFLDLDQDGDLDLLVAQYGSTAEEALALLKGKGSRGPGLAVFLNVGEVPAANPSQDPPPLKPSFRAESKDRKGLASLLGGAVPLVALAASDLDQDGDLDLVALADRTAPELVLNDRLLTFRRQALPGSLFADPDKGEGPPAWNGGLVLDVNRDRRSDLLLLPAGRRPVVLLNRAAAGEKDAGKWFEQSPTNSPPLLQAQAIDLDLDGWTDVVGLSAAREPVFLQNESGRLVHRPGALGADGAWPKDLVALVVDDFDGDGLPDVLGWSEKEGLRLLVNQGNGNHGVWLELSGHRRASGQNTIRCNADGLGTWVTAQSADHWTGAEYTTRSAGLGQSLRPLLLGVGKHEQAEVVRLRWPDNCWQAEFNVPAGRVTRIEEEDRKPGSCPVLFAWNGRRFVFVTDFLGAGSIGEALPGGGYRPPRPEESVKIEAHQLVPRDGRYTIKVAEPMSEVTYLDRLLLVAVDHPADLRVYPDERFTAPAPPPSQDLLAFRTEVFPVRARDHRGRDVTAALRHWDRDTADGFLRRAWPGLAEEHWVELDFGDRLAQFGPKDRLILCLAGWTDYPYLESLWAADQAGVALLPPVLERRGEDGRWHTVNADMGFPAGLTRLMTVEVTGKLSGPRCVLRLRTNMQVYWDQVFVAPLLERVPSPARPGPAGMDGEPAHFRVACLPVQSATLEARGCAQEFSPDGKQPTIYDHDRLEKVPLSQLSGRLTRLGEVTELLHQRDDRFVIFGPGDEVTVYFDARSLPPLTQGWRRSFVLRTWGYCKSAGTFIATGDSVGPLPFAAMSNFPYRPGEHYPRNALLEEYQRRFNTRRIGTGR